MPQLHLDETTLIDFALGHLDAAERQAVERELASSGAEGTFFTLSTQRQAA